MICTALFSLTSREICCACHKPVLKPIPKPPVSITSPFRYSSPASTFPESYIFFPESGGNVKVKAGLVFLHGFQQWPPAHASLLQPLAELGILVMAPCADIEQIITDASMLVRLRLQMNELQDMLAERGLLCLEMLGDPERFRELPDFPEVISSHIGTRPLPVGLCGYSFGAGILLPVALAHPAVQAVFAIAPYPVGRYRRFQARVAAESPQSAHPAHSQRHAKRKVLYIISGSLDALANTPLLHELAAAARKEGFCVTEERLAWGSHEGFMDSFSWGDIATWAGAFVAVSLVVLPGIRSLIAVSAGLALTAVIGPLLNFGGLQPERVVVPEYGVTAAVLSFIASCMLGRLLPVLTHQPAVTSVRIVEFMKENLLSDPGNSE